MSFYNRKIPFYKSFRVIDTDGDGKKDTIAYKPYSDFFNIQFGIEQDVRNIGHYNLGENKPFEVIDSVNLWDLSNDGSNDNNNVGPPNNLTPITGDTIGTDLQQSGNEFCADPNANNFNESLIGNPAFTPCPNHSCCTYLSTDDYSSGSGPVPGGGAPGSEPLECLTVYTDWGPWNDNLLLNDSSQIYNVGNNGGTNNSCTITLRFINQNDDNNGYSMGGFGVSQVIEGGWNGIKIKIEVDSGSGFQVINQGNPMINSVEESLEFNNSKWTLGKKVRLFLAADDTPLSTGGFGVQQPINYYSTKPYRDLELSPPIGSQIKITYYNQQSPTNINPNLTSTSNDFRLQIFQGSTPTTPPVKTPTSSWTWEVGVTNSNPQPIGTNPLARYNQGESFYYIDTSTSSNAAKSKIHQIWEDYLSGILTVYLPWGPNNSDVMSTIFWNNPLISLERDFGNDALSPVAQTLPPSFDLNWITNPSEVLANWTPTCPPGSSNIVSYFDKNGDGYIEWDSNYPTIDNNNHGSVDDGLFSKTRYDSPYIYIKPGTTDGINGFLDNPLTQTTGTAPETVGPASSGGWKNYAWKPNPSNSNYFYTNVSPTCQLGGVDNLFNVDPNLVDQSNSNIFLPQTDVGPNGTMTERANIRYFYNNQLTEVIVNHVWNVGTTDSRGGCCAKQYGSQYTFNATGPYMASECSQCHNQLTTRSAQPVFDPQTKINMQTTDSDVFYGPFFDPTNPSYNGYGLAYSKANNYCRNIKSKNGVENTNSPEGTQEDETFIGGIMHGGAIQYAYNSTNYNMFQDTLGTTPTSTNISQYGVAWEPVSPPCLSSGYLPRKCIPVLGGAPGSNLYDPNCLSAKCMKCKFCFKCSPNPIQPGIFVGSTSTAPSGTGGSTSGTTSGPNSGVNPIPSVNLIDNNSGPIIFNVSNSPTDSPGSTPGDYNGTIEITINNPNNTNNLQILTDTSVIPGTSGDVDIIFEITDTSTQTVHTTITYTVTTPNTNTESINLPIGAYTYTLQSNVTMTSYGITQISLI